MAFVCDYCEFIYQNKRGNCPTCGGAVREDRRSIEKLLADGFEYAPSYRGAGERPLDGGREPSLRDLYNAQHGVGGSERTEPTPEAVPKPAPEPVSDPSPEPSGAGGGFFGQFQSSGPVHIPEAVFDTPPEEEPEIPDPGRQRPLPRRRIRVPGHTPVRLPGVNWSLVFRLILLLSVVGTIGFLWSQRYAILGGIFDLIFALLPIALTIGAVIWLLRMLIRGR